MKCHKNTVLVIFEKDFSARHLLTGEFNVIVANKIFKKDIEASGSQFIELEAFVDGGSVYEASILLEELPKLFLDNDLPITKSFIYNGYELWWLHYGNLFSYFCFPYTRYKRLLEYLNSFYRVFFYRPPHKSFFSCYFQAHKREMTVLHESSFK